ALRVREMCRRGGGIWSDRAAGLGPNKVLSGPAGSGIAIEKWMQKKQGIQQDLRGGTGGGPGGAGGPGGPAAAAPVREAIGGEGGPEATAALRAGGPEQDFIGACPDCGSQLALIEGCA